MCDTSIGEPPKNGTDKPIETSNEVQSDNQEQEADSTEENTDP